MDRIAVTTQHQTGVSWCFNSALHLYTNKCRIALNIGSNGQINERARRYRVEQYQTVDSAVREEIERSVRVAHIAKTILRIDGHKAWRHSICRQGAVYQYD